MSNLRALGYSDVNRITDSFDVCDAIELVFLTTVMFVRNMKNAVNREGVNFEIE